MHKIFSNLILIADEYQVLFLKKSSLYTDYQLFNLIHFDLEKFITIFQSIEIYSKIFIYNSFSQ